MFSKFKLIKNKQGCGVTRAQENILTPEEFVRIESPTCMGCTVSHSYDHQGV